MKKIMFVLAASLVLVGCASVPNLGGEQNGHSISAYENGMRYLVGRGVAQNDSEAFRWLSMAANDDNPFAENELGYLYAVGRGTARNDETSFTWYQKAANHDLASAQYNLGLMLAQGIGTAVNKELAIEWLQKSANHQFEPAKLALKRYGTQ